jgi:hypothetical protein
MTDAKCVFYGGPPLLCLEIDTNERLDSALQKIDIKFCSISGGIDPYPGYNTYCLSPINTQKEFVEKISQRFCILETSTGVFINTTFPAAITDIQTQITNLNKTGFNSCSLLGVLSTDTLSTALFKVSEYICSTLPTSLDVSSVNWEQCVTIGGNIPTTIQEGFSFVINQLCVLQSQIGSGSASLPTFNNTGTCLPTPGVSDSTVDTIIKIRTRLCQTPVFAASNLTSQCVQFSGINTLEDVLNATLSKVDQLSLNIPNQFNTSHFVVAPIDPLNLCLGKTVSLNVAALAIDRKVAVNAGDATPGTLDIKLASGTGISLSTSLNPGKMTISATNTVDEKVKSDITDPTSGYLNDKLTGSADTVTISTSLESNQVKVSATINYTALINAIFDNIEDDEDLKARLCSIIATCPSPCSAPTNVSVQYIP